MPDYSALFTAFNLAANERITSKDEPNSIDPVDVGGTFTDFSDLLLPIVNTINGFNILDGVVPPTDSDGEINDEYFEFGSQLKVYKKSNLSSPLWALKASGDLGVNILDGNINVQATVEAYEVTASSGQWGIDNTIYTKVSPDTYTVPTPDLNFGRIDGLFGDKFNAVNYVSGVASSTPAQPATPADSVLIGYVFVPPSVPGDLPYILGSNAPTPLTLTTTGTTGVATLLGNVLNIPDYSAGSISVTIDVSSTPYSKSTLNAAYPSAKKGAIVIQDGANATYIKKDNSSTGEWSTWPSVQLT